MLNPNADVLQFHGEALKLRAERQRVLAANIANADTPNYKAADFDFKAALQSAVTGVSRPGEVQRTDLRHLRRDDKGTAGVEMLFRTPSQLALDGNSVEMDTERAAFAENAVRYEASLRFLNAQIKAMTTAIQGQ